eukprot:g38165.t1
MTAVAFSSGFPDEYLNTVQSTLAWYDQGPGICHCSAGNGPWSVLKIEFNHPWSGGKSEYPTDINQASPTTLHVIFNEAGAYDLAFKIKKRGEHAPIYINGAKVESVESVKFLGVTITADNLPLTSHVDAMVRKAQQRLFIRQLRKFGMSIGSLSNFYRYTVENILTGTITAWYGNCSAQDRKKLQKVVTTAQTIMEANLPSMDSIYTACFRGKAANIIKDPSHP